jgi:hypothetical protein
MAASHLSECPDAAADGEKQAWKCAHANVFHRRSVETCPGNGMTAANTDVVATARLGIRSGMRRIPVGREWTRYEEGEANGVLTVVATGRTRTWCASNGASSRVQVRCQNQNANCRPQTQWYSPHNMKPRGYSVDRIEKK